MLKIIIEILIHINMYQTSKEDFNVLIDGKSFFDLPVKSEEEAYEKLLRWVEIMITQLVTYWILLISKEITD